MQKVYCIGCEYFDMDYSTNLTPCTYVKKSWVEDTPVAQEIYFDRAIPCVDNKDNNCFYYTPKKKEPSHFLGKISNFFKTYFG